MESQSYGQGYRYNRIQQCVDQLVVEALVIAPREGPNYLYALTGYHAAQHSYILAVVRTLTSKYLH